MLNRGERVFPHIALTPRQVLFIFPLRDKKVFIGIEQIVLQRRATLMVRVVFFSLTPATLIIALVIGKKTTKRKRKIFNLLSVAIILEEIMKKVRNLTIKGKR